MCEKALDLEKLDEEILNRADSYESEGDEETDEEFEGLVKAELRYPERWDTEKYPTVWHALFEEYLQLKEKETYHESTRWMLEICLRNSSPRR